jgi:uncharacterized protein YkwD
MNSSIGMSIRLAACASLVLGLAACGGGGGDPPAALSASPVPTSPVTATPVTTSGPGTGSTPESTPAMSATCGLTDFAALALARINQLRAAGASCGTQGSFAPTTPLAWSNGLIQASAGHSQDMATANYFSHTSQDGRTVAERVNATGYGWRTLGENIAAGYASVDSVMDGWIASDGHCANLMNPNFTEVGLACVPGAAASAYNTYWTMDLGHPM